MATVGKGRAEEALPYLQEAVRLSPLDMIFGLFCTGLAFCHRFLQEYEQAVEWGKNAMRKPSPRSYLWVEMASLPASLAHLERDDEARKVRMELEAIRPDLNIELIRKLTVTVHPEYLDHLSEGLRMAGLPEN